MPILERMHISTIFIVNTETLMTRFLHETQTDFWQDFESNLNPGTKVVQPR